MLALVWYGLAVCFGLQNLNKLALGDMTRQNFQVKHIISGFLWFWYGLGVSFGLQNLNSLALGDMARQNFQVRAHCLRFSSAWYGFAVWFGLQNLTKFALGDMTRQNFPARVLTLGTFFDLVWRFGLVCKTWTSWRLEIWLGRTSWLEASFYGLFLTWYGGLVWSAKLDQIGAWRYD